VLKESLLTLFLLAASAGLAQAVSMNDKLKQIEDSQAEMRRSMGAPSKAPPARGNPPPARSPEANTGSAPANRSAPRSQPSAGGATASSASAAKSTASDTALRIGDFSFTSTGCVRLPNQSSGVKCNFLAENTASAPRNFRLDQILLINDERKQFNFVPIDLKKGVTVKPTDSAIFSATVPAGFSSDQVMAIVVANKVGNVLFENIAIDSEAKASLGSGNKAQAVNPDRVFAPITSNQIGTAKIVNADVGIELYPGSKPKPGTASKMTKDNKDMVFVTLETVDNFASVVSYYREQVGIAANDLPVTDVKTSADQVFVGFANGVNQESLSVTITKALKTTEVTIMSSRDKSGK
jgi:hypothetical protein